MSPLLNSNSATDIARPPLALTNFFRLAAAVGEVCKITGDSVGKIDALLAKGITINGLVMINDEPWVDGYYNENVVGGPGAFLMQVEDYRSFAAAIRQKLVSEIVALPRWRDGLPS